MTIPSLRMTVAAASLAAMTVLPVLMVPGVAAAAGNSADVAAGKKLAFNRSKGNCLACHHIAGGTQMGDVGPSLKNMKQRYPDKKLLFDRIYDEQKYNPMTVMPTFGKNGALTKKEIHDIVAFLLTL